MKTEAQKRANAKYNAKAYERLSILVKTGEKQVLKDFVEERGKSVNGFVNEAIKEKMEREK